MNPSASATENKQQSFRNSAHLTCHTMLRKCGHLTLTRINHPPLPPPTPLPDLLLTDFYSNLLRVQPPRLSPLALVYLMRDIKRLYSRFTTVSVLFTAILPFNRPPDIFHVHKFLTRSGTGKATHMLFRFQLRLSIHQ